RDGRRDAHRAAVALLPARLARHRRARARALVPAAVPRDGHGGAARRAVGDLRRRVPRRRAVDARADGGGPGAAAELGDVRSVEVSGGGRRITSATRVAAVLGWPVAPSKSPALHNAAFAAAGVDAVYVALPVPPAELATVVRALAATGA